MTLLLRGLGRFLLVFYVLIVIVVLGLRYWLLPHVDQWRAPVAQVLSVATNSQIHIGKLSAQWDGLLPEITIYDLQVQDRQLNQSIQIPKMTARIKWQSIWARQIQFSYLRIDDLQFELWRDPEQKLHFAGQTLNAETFNNNNNQIDPGLMKWLVQQDQIELKNAQLIWRDRSRDLMPLRIKGMDGVLRFQKEELQFDVVASPQVGLGQSVQLRGQLTRASLDGSQFDGLLYVQLNELSPAGWRQWLDLPTDLTQATLDTQLWLQVKENKITDVTMDTRVYNGVWQIPKLGQFKARSLRIFASSPWQSFKDFSNDLPLGQRLQAGAFRLEMYGQDVQWLENDFSHQSLTMNKIALVSQRKADLVEAPIEIQHFVMKNKDLNVELKGTWTPQGTDLDAGEFDVVGNLKYLELNQLYGYFPMPAVSPEVVEWLQHGLVRGVVSNANLRLQGNLHDFPYSHKSESDAEHKLGLFYIAGPFVNAEIDYYLPDADEKGWPKVEDATGQIILRGNELWINADTAILKPNGKDEVYAENVRVHINDLEAEEPILTVKAQTHGSAGAYLGLMQHSNLGALLDNAFDHTTATGQWQVPLDIRINLENAEEVQVKGSLAFSNNKVQLLSFLPPLEQVTGRLIFNENGAYAENIKAQWLGGPLVLKDQVGLPGQLLQMQGQAKSSALAQYTQLEQLENWLQGEFSYQLQVGFDKKNQFYISAFSDLNGLSSTFPTPLNKSANSTMPLAFTWQHNNEDAHALHLKLDQKLEMYLVENRDAYPLFKQGSLSWQKPLPALSATGQGFIIDIQQDDLDLDAWQAVHQVLLPASFSNASKKDNAFSLKDILRLRLQSDQAVLWDNSLQHLTYTMQQKPTPNQGYHWRVDISSKQVAGTVLWQLNKQEQLIGEVDAKLQRLHWNPEDKLLTNQVDPLIDPETNDFELKLPSIKLKIDDLRWKKWRLGELHLEGLKQVDDIKKWKIPLLSLSTPHGDLSATGFWQLAGAQRGLKLNAQLQSIEAGQLLDYVGIKNILAEGKGTVQAQLQWHGFPWQTQLEALDANIELDLSAGRIDQINSRTAKLLEFLSLQSLSRLSRLDFDLRGLMTNGFPFDDMKGRFLLNKNRLSTDNFRVVGPAGTIVIEGNTNISTEHLDLRAVVVPNVDMSGAAIAAGIALNPVVGIGAFITQLLFKAPLAKAMTVQYQLTGPWDQFETEEIKIKTP